MNKSLKAKIRCKKYRKKILEMSQSVSALHIGGSFSSVEIVDCIYNRLKKIRIYLFCLKDMRVFFST